MVLLKNIKENISYDAVSVTRFEIDNFFTLLGTDSGTDIIIEFENRDGIWDRCTLNESNCDKLVLVFNGHVYTYYDILKTPGIIGSVLEYYYMLNSVEELQ